MVVTNTYVIYTSDIPIVRVSLKNTSPAPKNPKKIRITSAHRIAIETNTESSINNIRVRAAISNTRNMARNQDLSSPINTTLLNTYSTNTTEIGATIAIRMDINTSNPKRNRLLIDLGVSSIKSDIRINNNSV
jgi:hypothetical protein